MARKPKAPTTEKPDSFSLNSRGEDKSPQIRHTRPEVAKHCARMIIAHNMVTEAAVARMLAEPYPDATEAQIVASWRAAHNRRPASESKAFFLENKLGGKLLQFAYDFLDVAESFKGRVSPVVE